MARNASKQSNPSWRPLRVRKRSSNTAVHKCHCEPKAKQSRAPVARPWIAASPGFRRTGTRAMDEGSRRRPPLRRRFARPLPCATGRGHIALVSSSRTRVRCQNKRQSERRFRRDRAVAVDDLVEPLRRHPQLERERGRRSCRAPPILPATSRPDDNCRTRSTASSMIIHDFDVVGVAVLEPEHQPPRTVDRNDP